MSEVTVKLLEAEQTLVEIFTVQLWVKVRHILLTQQIGTQYVKPGTSNGILSFEQPVIILHYLAHFSVSSTHS